jgi:hypothetical protein
MGEEIYMLREEEKNSYPFEVGRIWEEDISMAR